MTNLYIGMQCPNFCHGHGRCLEGGCHCDDGFDEEECDPKEPLPRGMKTDFSMMSQLDRQWEAIDGGHVVSNGDGCGTMVSGESLYFAKASFRKFERDEMQFMFTF